jgi:hypothetical protein
MTESFARRQPSNNLEELQGQLLRELAKLQERSGDEPELFRAYVQHALVLAWRGVAGGRMQAPREALDCLRVAQPFIDHFMPAFSEPAAVAAAEIYILIQSLSLASEALEERRVEDRISDPRSETERAILEVLADNLETFLRRGEIYDRLKPAVRPTAPRVGQILAELHEENVVQTIHGRAQGNPNAAFYALSRRGVELCRNLELTREQREEVLPTQIMAAIEVACDPSLHWQRRRVAKGVLATEGLGPRKTAILKALIEQSGSDPDVQVQRLIDEAIQEVVNASRAPLVHPKGAQNSRILFSQNPKEEPQPAELAFAVA